MEDVNKKLDFLGDVSPTLWPPLTPFRRHKMILLKKVFQGMLSIFYILLEYFFHSLYKYILIL